MAPLYTQVRHLQETPKKEREAAAFIVKELEPHLVKGLPNENDPNYLKAVETAFKKSRLYDEAQLAAARSSAKSTYVDPNSEEGERAKRALSAEHIFYGQRYNGLTQLSVFCRSVRTDDQVRQARDSMIAEFRQSITTTNGYDPRDAMILTLLLRSITDKGLIRPQLVLLLCRWFLNATPSSTCYSIANWLNILPTEDLETILAGEPVPINPGHRALDIGKAVHLATSFPLMPETAPWDLASWNTTTLNNVYANGAKALAKPRIWCKDNRTTTKVIGLAEINSFLEDNADASGAARITLAIEDDVIDLRPLLQHLKSLGRKEQSKRKGDSKKTTDAKPNSV